VWCDSPIDCGDPSLDADDDDGDELDSPPAGGRRRAPPPSSTAWFVCKQLVFLLTGCAFGGLCFVAFHRVANAAVVSATGVNMAGTGAEVRAKAEAEALRVALDEAVEAKRRAAFRRHHGGAAYTS
jgi:hypothetical protein